MSQIRIREGFKDQILYVVPRNAVARFNEHPLIFPLMPTDIGSYPRARFHYCEREQGAQEHILIFCTDGSGWYEIDGQRGTVQQNEALLIRRNTPHVYAASDKSPWSINWLHFIGSSADLFVRQLSADEHTVAVDDDTSTTLGKLFSDCCNALATGFVLQRMIYASQTLHHLLATLFFDNRAFAPMLQTSRFHNLDATLAYLEQNIDNPLTLADMAAHARLSPSHFSRLFKEQTGYSPMDYFIHLKMQTACKLLYLTDLTVREVSFELGYSDPYYFSRLFKKVMGMSPMQYRSQPRGEMTERLSP
ncbi:AraC family transcriptional regulator [Phototrophicus methaneseepsis]|uniref:AraC family transcriptional regulator n=1 Tax=Phototrophicus methaneseepsis TaxID=2710758 RepID=A0A7S8EAQ6_9CHLR|nr:AraC family transcriptional regulator [Phototrophicus methaneseepsis]QPC83363.1 AraC family transcriptional regulator [Phototrophicus methaneseepsis]